MTNAIGVDSSYDPLTVQEADCLVAAGVEVYEQDIWDGVSQPAPRVANLRLMQQRNRLLVAYIALPKNCGLGSYHVDQALQGMPVDLVSFIDLWCVDVELPGIQASAIRAAISTLQGRGLRPAIYTSLNAWENYVIFDAVNTPTSFTDVPLQNAYWPLNQQPPSYPGAYFATAPFGGWTPAQVIGEQYTGDDPLCNQETDRDLWNKEFLLGGNPMPDPTPTPPTPAQKATAAGYLLGIAAKLAAGGDLTDTDKQLLRFFGA